MKVTVIGTGYVGTVAGACFADAGHRVICVDQNEEKVTALRKGDPLIYEPGLQELMTAGIEAGRLSFSTSIEESVRKSDLVFLTVGTPQSENGSADLSDLQQAVRSVGRAMNSYKVIVTKSTVPVGTHRKVMQWIRQETLLPFDVVSNPEFLREGAAIQDFISPERVIIGAEHESVYRILLSLYTPLLGEKSQVFFMDPISAELTKYACNAFLATRISFTNELARLCEVIGADIEKVRKGMGSDRRIGPHFLRAGIGYGGSCFPKDTRALLSTAKEVGMKMSIVEAVEEVNRDQKTHLLKRIREEFDNQLEGRTIALWGLAFKAKTDDIREAPALVLAKSLADVGARVQAYDPVAMPKVMQAGLKEQNFVCVSSMEDALDQADALVIATEWDEFRTADLSSMKELMRGRHIFDGRNLFSTDEEISRFEKLGFLYFAVGRPSGARVLPLRRRPLSEDQADETPPASLTAV